MRAFNRMGKLVSYPITNHDIDLCNLSLMQTVSKHSFKDRMYHKVLRSVASAKPHPIKMSICIRAPTKLNILQSISHGNCTV
jgi:hypothetical protein